jgi:hypothetical protein
MFFSLADTSLHVIVSCSKVLLSLSQIKSSQVVQTKEIGTNPMKITYYDNNKCFPTFSISSFFDMFSLR